MGSTLICVSSHMHHLLLLPLSPRPKAESKGPLKGPGEPVHSIAHEDQMRGKPPVLGSLLSQCTLTWNNNESPSPAAAPALETGQRSIQPVINPSDGLHQPMNGGSSAITPYPTHLSHYPPKHTKYPRVVKPPFVPLCLE